MCEILVRAFSTTNEDPVKNERGCWKKYDVVDIRPDGFLWGAEECPPKFEVIKVPTVAVEDLAYLRQTVTDNSDPQKGPVTMLRSKYSLNYDELPQSAGKGETPSLTSEDILLTVTDKMA